MSKELRIWLHRDTCSLQEWAQCARPFWSYLGVIHRYDPRDSPPNFRDGSQIWRVGMPIFCFEIMEMHVPDRILHQFVFTQHIPDVVDQLALIYPSSKRQCDWRQSIVHIQANGLIELIDFRAINIPSHFSWTIWVDIEGSLIAGSFSVPIRRSLTRLVVYMSRSW